MHGVHQFRAMGAASMVSIYAPANAQELAQLGAARVELLEQSWSRFRESSELNRLNSLAGSGPVEVSADLLTLVWHMQRAWNMTDGLFDPAMLKEIKAEGYDADYATVIARDALTQAATWQSPAPMLVKRVSAMANIEIDLDASTVRLPAGVGIDPGAIGKGLGADIVSRELIDAGATGVLVDLGGDIVVAGTPDDGDTWVIEIEDERNPDDPDRDSQLVSLKPDMENDRGESFGIATSSTLYRRWAGGTRHHVLDPRTGVMADPDLVQATVWSGAGWLSEVLATAAMLMKPEQARAWLATHDAGYTLMTSASMWTSEEKVQHG